MSRRKVQWRRRAVQAGSLVGLHKVLPTARVVGQGVRAYDKSPRPHSGQGQVVTQPVSGRKRQLIEQWVTPLWK